MKQRLAFIALVASLTVSVFSPLRAQWQWTGVPSDSNVRALSNFGSNLFVGTENNVYLSSDNGTNWIAADSGLPHLYLNVNDFAMIGTNLFLGTISHLYRSTNNGATWSDDGGGSTATFALLGTNLFAATRFSGVIRSTDSGASWHSTGSLPNAEANSVVVFGHDVFAGDVGNPTYRSTNSGNSWQPVLDVSYPIGASKTGVFATLGSGRIVRSTDGGNNWIHADSGLSGVGIDAFLANGADLFLGTDSGVFYSTNEGANWRNVSSGLPNGQVWNVTANDKYLFAGIYGAGVWRRPLSDFNQSGVTSELPSTNSISLDNYPDPTISRTTISFSLPEAGEVILSITDAAGRETPILHSTWTAAGRHEAAWDASKFPSGVYLCRLESGGQSAARRVVVMH